MWFWNSLQDTWTFFSAPVMVEVYGWLIGVGVLSAVAYGAMVAVRQGWEDWSRWVVRRFPPK